MFGIGAGEFIVILIVGLIVFGPSKLPEVGRAIGKGLREFRKAQAALSQTLNEVEEPLKSATTDNKSSTVAQNSTVDKSSTVDKPVDKPPVKPLTTESFIGDKNSTVDKTSTDAQSATVDKTVAQTSTVEKNSPVDKAVDKPPQVTADDVIKFAKENPLGKENHHEKISDGNPADVADDVARTSPAGARRSSNGVDKQP
ncbi:MAG: twin-arginine translocase TatA/TatE family subunit [Selenomonadaceae bacterium]|nr:twin-arginine translocase TatA/TatE family subunit [Selenomonadaceae bacterium]